MKAMFFSRQKPKEPGFDDQLENLRAAGFVVERRPDSRARVTRGGCGAIVAAGPRIEQEGWMSGGEIAALIDGGFQKFWSAGARRAPALAPQLQALHAFEEDLREALGLISFYNTSLGTTNDQHQYDRLSGR